MLLQPQTNAKHRPAVRVDKPPVAAGVVTQPPRSNVTWDLDEPGSEARWHQLQPLRRGLQSADSWLEALLCEVLTPEADLLEALIPRLDRGQVERLLDGLPGAQPALLLSAVHQQWPALVADEVFQQAWLEPLLHHVAEADAADQLVWLQLLGQFRDPRVALLLRQAIAAGSVSEAAWPLLPLLGLQRQGQDAALLQRVLLEPGSRQRRLQALEGLALGLSTWPQPALTAALSVVVSDLDAALAAKAVDLLARLPAGSGILHRCLTQSLDPTVLARVQRRLRCAPLVLVVHGRQGGEIPQELQQLALELEQRRGAPVLLQALTAAEVSPTPSLLAAAQQAGHLTLVPLLLLPGGHVRGDVPQIARAWALAAQASGVGLCRRPFLGGWPAWQRTLAAELFARQAGPQRRILWLHHPLEGALPARFVRYLSRVLGCQPLSAPYRDPMASLQGQPLQNTLLLPLTLAANRLSETLATQVCAAGSAPGQPEVLPPLLAWPGLRRFLLNALTELP